MKSKKIAKYKVLTENEYIQQWNEAYHKLIERSREQRIDTLKKAIEEFAKNFVPTPFKFRKLTWKVKQQLKHNADNS